MYLPSTATGMLHAMMEYWKHDHGSFRRTIPFSMGYLGRWTIPTGDVSVKLHLHFRTVCERHRLYIESDILTHQLNILSTIKDI